MLKFSLRLCEDYHGLNKLTIKNKYPSPQTNDMFDYLYGAKVFPKVDIKSGYHQVKDSNIEMTTIWSQLGRYEYAVMLFGPTNAPTTSMVLMNTLFCKYLGKFVLVFMKYNLIQSKMIMAQSMITHYTPKCNNICNKGSKAWV